MAMPKLNVTNKKKAEKFLKEIGCITLGTIAGVLVYVFCLIINLAIFGWNLGLVLSPLAAGFILFIVTVVYGFIIANPTLGYNLITAGSIVVIIQAAIPTVINYFLIAIVLGIFSDMLGIFKKIYNFFYGIYSRIVKRHDHEPKIQKREFVSDFQLDEEEAEVNDMGVLLLSTSDAPDNFIIHEYKGIYQGNTIIKANQLIWLESEKEGIEDYYISILQHAKNQALVQLIENLKNGGCNGVIDITPSYNSLGTEGSGNVLQVSVAGTGVIMHLKNKFIHITLLKCLKHFHL